jgi:hypothetical protein
VRKINMESYYILVRNETQIGNTRYPREQEAILEAKLLVEDCVEDTTVLICKVVKTATIVVQRPKAIINSLKD